MDAQDDQSTGVNEWVGLYSHLEEIILPCGGKKIGVVIIRWDPVNLNWVLLYMETGHPIILFYFFPVA